MTIPFIADCAGYHLLGGSEAASLANLVDPAKPLVKIGSPSFADPRFAVCNFNAGAQGFRTTDSRSNRNGTVMVMCSFPRNAAGTAYAQGQIYPLSFNNGAYNLRWIGSTQHLWRAGTPPTFDLDIGTDPGRFPTRNPDNDPGIRVFGPNLPALHSISDDGTNVRLTMQEGHQLKEFTGPAMQAEVIAPIFFGGQTVGGTRDAVLRIYAIAYFNRVLTFDEQQPVWAYMMRDLEERGVFDPGFVGALRISDLARPALVLSDMVNAFGDSITFGVGAPTGQDYPNRFRAIATGPTGAFNGGTGANNGAAIVEIGNGGIGGENTGSINARILALAGSHPAQMARTHFYCGGGNNFNPAVPGNIRVWPEQVKADFATASAAVTGGKRMFALLTPADNHDSSGTRIGADHRFHFLDMVATYGERVFDLARYLRFVRQLQAPVGTADADALEGGFVPYTYRGFASAADFDGTDRARITGIANPTDLNHPESTIFWQSTSSNAWRKIGASGTGSWELVDRVHYSRHGNEQIARLVGDIALAEQGNGPAVPAPARLRIAANAPAGTVVGQIHHVGDATEFTLRTYADEAVSGFAISAAGVITKATAAALTEGVEELVVVTRNAHGTLIGPVDIYVTRPTTETAPELRPIVAPGISIGGRRSDAMITGKQFSGAFYFSAAARATQTLLAMARTATSGNPPQPVAVQLLSNGRQRLTFRDSTGTNVQQTIDLQTALYDANVPAWLLFAVDFATNTRVAYLTEAAHVVSSLTLTGDLLLADAAPTFLAGNEMREFRALADPFIGGIGFMATWDRLVDWSNAANRRALFAADGTPAARTPYTAIGGHVPNFELWGGKGDWAWGSPDGSFGPKLLSAARRLRTVMS